MARQRMYLYERAYVDYGSRLRRFYRWMNRTVSDTWMWFWDGPGSRIFEVIISIALLAGAGAAVYFYVRYETSRGRGFSLSMLAAILVIFGVALAVLFAWKGVLHFLARVAAGITAAGLIAVLLVLALAAAMVVFSVYLVVLFVLTALSFIIFLPMRLFNELSLLVRRITYRCPYDDCGGHGQPIHVCSCGTEYTDLMPSFFGIFHHTCRHGVKDVRLPTMDFLGRSKLPRLCGSCKRPLILSSIGELSEKPVAIIGGPTVGKTVYLRQAVRLLRQHLGGFRGAVVAIDSPEQENELNRDLSLLDHGQLPAKTTGTSMNAFGLAVRIPRKLRALLYLFDAPGEHFVSLTSFSYKQVVQHLNGIVLIVDPFALSDLEDFAGDTTSETPFSDTVSVLISGVNQMLVRRPTDSCGVPLAVVIAKADALPVDDFPFLANLVTSAANPHDEALNTRCRQALEKLGEGGSVRALEQKFSNIQYFACSALGRSASFGNNTAFQPKGVIEPLLWLLKLEASGKARAGAVKMVASRASAGD